MTTRKGLLSGLTAAGLACALLTAPVATAAPAATNPSAWPSLSSQLQPVIDDAARHGVTMGVFVSDLTGRFDDTTLYLGKQTSYTTASTIKLSLATEIMHQVDAGTLSLDDVYTITEAEKYGGTGSLQNNPFPQDVSVRTMLQLMITISDNTATNKLVDVVGGFDVINAHTEAAGIAKSDLHFGRKMFGAILPPDGDLWATPYGYKQLLDLIYRTSQGTTGTFLSPAGAQYLIGLMHAQQVNTKLGAVIPSSVIAHKTGENNTVSHDIGYLLLPGRDLSIGVFTQNDAGVADYDEWQALANPYVQQIGILVYNYQLNGSGTGVVAPPAKPQPVAPR